jgi:HSP20 family protein
MSVLVKKSRASQPSHVRDFFATDRFLAPRFFDVDNDLLDFDGRPIVIPSANITESEKNYKVELAAPGLERNDFTLEVQDGVLNISAEREEEENEEGENYRRREFSYNTFSRSFTLPENCNPDKIDAKYEDGILRISLPKKEMTISKPAKQIKVS